MPVLSTHYSKTPSFGGRFCSLTLCYADERGELLLVEADDHLVVHEDDGDAHLPALLYHFLALLEVGLDVEVRVRDVVLSQEILGELAKVARRGAVDSDFFIHRFKFRT